jgi:hypothetical protein
VFWVLLSLLVVASLVLLALTLLVLYRRVRLLGRQVGQVGATAAEATALLDTLNKPVRAAPPCPTCGAPATAATRRVAAQPTAVRP